MRYLMAVVVWLAALSLDSLYCMQVSEPSLSIELKTGGPTVSELREQYRSLDQQCLELAKRLRSNQDAAPANRQSLTELVGHAFRVRQDLQRAEVAESARRLQTIQQTIDSREGLKSQIVQRRVDELLDPNVDWSKSTSSELKEAIPGERSEPVRDDRLGESNASPFDLLLSGNRLPGIPNAKSDSIIGAADVLRVAPSELRKVLKEKVYDASFRRKNFEELRNKLAKEGDDQKLLADLKNSQAILKDSEQQLHFAKLQYDETIKYLEVALESVKHQMKIAMDEYKFKAHLFNVGSASQSDLNSVTIRRRQLEVELQRAESLLKIYRAAGDFPELAEVRKPSGSTLGFNIADAKLGVPVWIEGRGGLTTSPGGYAIVSNDQVGLVAQILFSNIPDHENARLMLKVEAPVSVSDALRSRGVAEMAWHSVREVSISEAEIQAAIDGKPFRKSYFLRPDGSMVEKDTDSEAAKSEKDPLVATIELAVP